MPALRRPSLPVHVWPRGLLWPQHDDHHRLPLLEAVPNGNIEIVEILLKAGAKPDVENRHGDTPASMAQRRKHPEIETLLLKDEL